MRPIFLFVALSVLGNRARAEHFVAGDCGDAHLPLANSASLNSQRLDFDSNALPKGSALEAPVQHPACVRRMLGVLVNDEVRAA